MSATCEIPRPGVRGHSFIDTVIFALLHCPALICQYEDEKVSNVERKWKEVLLFFPAVFVKVNLALYGVQRERMI